MHSTVIAVGDGCILFHYCIDLRVSWIASMLQMSYMTKQLMTTLQLQLVPKKSWYRFQNHPVATMKLLQTNRVLSIVACFRYRAWVGFTDKKKAELFKRVLVDSGQRQPLKTVQSTGDGIRVLQTDHQPDDDDHVQHPAPITVQSSISSLHVLNTSAGTVRRPRSTRTTATTTKHARDKTIVIIKSEPDSDSANGTS